MIVRAAAFAAAIAALLSWDVVVAGRAVQRGAPARSFRLLSGLTGFLVAPAMLVQFGAQSAITGRVLTGLSWIGPLMFSLCAVQVACAWRLRAVRPAVALSLFAFNGLQLVIAVVTWGGARGFAVPNPLWAPVLAQAGLFTSVFGPSAFASPFAIVVPLLAPAVPPRGRAGAALRTLIAVGATAAIAALATATPSAMRDLEAYEGLGRDRIAERIHEPFASGLSILPELRGVPSATNLRDDLALADSLDASALLVRVSPEGATAAALDSLARALEPRRRDSTLVLIAIDAGIAGPLVTADRVMRRLRPDYLVLYGTHAPGPLSRIAALAHRLRPATRVAVQLAPTVAEDSALFDWATSGASPVDAIFFSLYPAPASASRTSVALATAERWMRNERRVLEHWLLAVGAPTVEGEDAQRRLVRQVLAWGTARALVQGVVFGEAADYSHGTGLRTVNGRLRAAAGDAATAFRTLNENSSPPVP